MNKRTWIWIIVIVLIIIVGVLLFSSGNQATDTAEDQQPDTEQTAPDEDTDQASPDDDVATTTPEEDSTAIDEAQQSGPVEEEGVSETARKLTITAQGFDPGSIEVNSGETVTIAVTSGDDQTHVWKVRDFPNNIAIGVAPGETREITFDAPEPGEYEMYCDVPGHSGRGETGTLIVN